MTTGVTKDLPPRRIRLPRTMERGKCRWCKGDVPKGRFTWCSEACVEDYKIKSDPNFVRRLLKRRDKGVCAVCGLDCLALQEELRQLRQQAPDGTGGYLSWMTRKAELGMPFGRTTLWDADHVVPVIEGGGQCGLDGYRTLCWRCHATETAALAARRAAARRRE